MDYLSEYLRPHRCIIELNEILMKKIPPQIELLVQRGVYCYDNFLSQFVGFNVPADLPRSPRFFVFKTKQTAEDENEIRNPGKPLYEGCITDSEIYSYETQTELGIPYGGHLKITRMFTDMIKQCRVLEIKYETALKAYRELAEKMDEKHG